MPDSWAQSQSRSQSQKRSQEQSQPMAITLTAIWLMSLLWAKFNLLPESINTRTHAHTHKHTQAHTHKHTQRHTHTHALQQVEAEGKQSAAAALKRVGCVCWQLCEAYNRQYAHQHTGTLAHTHAHTRRTTAYTQRNATQRKAGRTRKPLKANENCQRQHHKLNMYSIHLTFYPPSRWRAACHTSGRGRRAGSEAQTSEKYIRVYMYLRFFALSLSLLFCLAGIDFQTLIVLCLTDWFVWLLCKCMCVCTCVRVCVCATLHVKSFDIDIGRTKNQRDYQ